MTAATLPLSADKRVPFIAEVAFAGFNYSGATFLMHVRNQPGDTGTPLISLSNATAGTEGISVVYDTDFEYTDPKTGTIIPIAASLVTINIAEATLEALALNNPANRPLTLAYDMHVTPSGGTKVIALQGPFIINPGVTV